MKKTISAMYRITVALIVSAVSFLSSCNVGDENTISDQTINIAAIHGVVVPAYGETPVTAITETAQFRGSVSWSPTVNSGFAADTVYTATIALTAKNGYSLAGVMANSFTLAGAASVSNNADSGVVTAVFPETASIPPETINIEAIHGVVVPAYGETPVTAITETAQFRGSVSWSPTVNSGFAADTVYTATIALTAKNGYTLAGVMANSFTLAGAASVSNNADSGVVTAVFPETASVPPETINIAAIHGVVVPAYGETPVTAITETAQFRGSVSWSPTVNSGFAADTVYTATIALTAKNGYTLAGVMANSFTLAGAASVSNNADSGVVTAVFPATGAAASESGFLGVSAVKQIGTITVGSETANMIYANNQSSMSFLYGTNDSYLDTITTQFFISETEVTWGLMAEVLQWALDNGKIRETRGANNEVNANSVMYGSRELIQLDIESEYMKLSYVEETDSFSVISGFENYPVVCVTWYGAIMFCNWLTEMRDGNTDNVVYRNISYNSWDHRYTFEYESRNGYRLPSISEWEYAARYINDANNDGDIADLGEYYPAGYPSGADSAYDVTSGARDFDGDGDVEYVENVAWYSGNTSIVRETAGLSANALGLYDMNGNVEEWCYPLYSYNGSYLRYIKGGPFNFIAAGMDVSIEYVTNPDSIDIDRGFRIVRTQ